MINYSTGQIFNWGHYEAEIIESFNGEALVGKKLHDFLPTIQDWEDETVLKEWIRFFVTKDIPFLITKEGNTFKMWTEKKGSKKET